MRVRTTQAFVDSQNRREAGEEFEMEDSVALERIKAGLVVRVEDEPEKAVLPLREKAVRRSKHAKGRRKK